VRTKEVQDKPASGGNTSLGFHTLQHPQTRSRFSRNGGVSSVGGSTGLALTKADLFCRRIGWSGNEVHLAENGEHTL
jgi:hypothetical protein